MKNKNVKKKLSRKDKFKVLKKEAVPMCSTPLFLKNLYKISTIADSGLFQVDEKVISKIYRLVVNDPLADAHKIFDVLRGYDVRFRIYYIQSNIYLNILFEADKSDAWAVCEDLIKDMKNKLGSYITLSDIDANERFKITHELIKGDNAYFERNYMDNSSILDWKEDFELSNLEESVDSIFIGDDVYGIYYVRAFSDKIAEFISDISAFEEVQEIVTQFDPVSDKAVHAFFKQNYMGMDNLVEKINIENSELFRIYMGNIKDDSKHFTMCGLMFLCNINDKEIDKKLHFIADRYDVEIAFYHTQLLDVYKDFLPFGKWMAMETRNMPSAMAYKVFLPQYLDNGDTDNTAENFIFSMDLSDGAATETVNYSIDDYDDADEKYEEGDE